MNRLRGIAVAAIVSFVAIFIQGTLLKLIAPGSMVVPNMLLLLVGFLAFYEVSIFGAVLSFCIGLTLDLSSGLLLGPWGAAFVSVYGMLSALSQRLFVESPLASFVAMFFSSILASFVYLVIVLQFQPLVSHKLSFSWLLLVEAIFTAVLAPFAFWALRWALLPSASSGSRGGFKKG